ncbi:MAG: 1-acyl-sn-glycerol-3-phosphate acyltransferase [Caulobacteraceae bacterium]
MPPASQHIVDELITERAPSLSGSPLWPLVRPALYKLLDYRKARWMADQVAPLSGEGALAFASRLLRLDMEVVGADNVPRQGRMLAVINHPTGLADGVAIYDALKPIRPDLIFFANADALRVNARMAEVIIPVEWVVAKRTREKTRATLEAAKAALEAERPLIISPAGRIARHSENGVMIDPPWQPTAASLARKNRAPILPVHIDGPASVLFQTFDRVSEQLRDVTLFHEMLNKTGKRFRVVFGTPIPPEAVEDAGEFTARLKPYIERDLGRDPKARFV